MFAFAPRFPATQLSETYARSDNLSRLTCKLANVNVGKSTAVGLRPRAVLKTTGTVFPYTDRPRQVNNMYVFIGRITWMAGLNGFFKWQNNWWVATARVEWP